MGGRKGGGGADLAAAGRTTRGGCLAVSWRWSTCRRDPFELEAPGGSLARDGVLEIYKYANLSIGPIMGKIIIIMSIQYDILYHTIQYYN